MTATPATPGTDRFHETFNATPAIRHPEIEVELIGQDGNAFNVLGLTFRALRKAGLDQAEIDEFEVEATAGDYDHLLATVTRWVSVS